MSTSPNTSPDVPNVDSADTTYSISFDFTAADQQRNLQYLQSNGYNLFAYKGASGSQQVTSGLPTWLALPFANMFGVVKIDYMPRYKVYVFNQRMVAPNTVIQMQAMSQEVSLGTSLIFNATGSFTVDRNSAPADSIQIKNYSPFGGPDLIVGLAAIINGVYAPFCAFTFTPQRSINITPHEKICMFASQSSAHSGLVTTNTGAPGCAFSLSAANTAYQLQVIGGTYGLKNVDGTPSVTQTQSGASLNQLLNS